MRFKCEVGRTEDQKTFAVEDLKMRGDLALAYLVCGLVAFAQGFCPQECHCQRENVSCSGGGLDIIPITLNPMMKRLSLKVHPGFILAHLVNYHLTISKCIHI